MSLDLTGEQMNFILTTLREYGNVVALCNTHFSENLSRGIGVGALIAMLLP